MIWDIIHLARDHMGWDGNMEEHILYDRPGAVQSLRRLGCLNVDRSTDPTPVRVGRVCILQYGASQQGLG